MSENDSSLLAEEFERDRICDQFEAAWEKCLTQTDPDALPPRLEAFLERVGGDNSSAMLRELISVDLAYCEQRGDRPSREEYLERFPEESDTIREVFTQLEREIPQTTEIPLPKKIGRYHVRHIVGSGAFGAVYCAYDEKLRRNVAIKVPHRQRLSSPADISTYLAEARILAKLNHPHIVSVYDVAEDDDGHPFIVSQLVEGTSLAKRFEVGRLDFRASAELICKIADALHYAHQQRLVHRDIKPANILLDSKDEPYLVDFGLALTEDDFGRLGPQGGTVAYMSPEQARGEGHLVDGRSDLFSLGSVFYEMLTGERPFRGQNWQDVLDTIIRVECPPPRMLDDSIPPELERICLKLLSKRVANRYAVGADLASDLQVFIRTGEPASSTLSATELRPKAKQVVPKGLRSFDSDDADFFLDLLPGPRDRDGLPESIRFWKSRIEKQDPDETFRIGLIYGPSGCGKSSLLKAGLLPRLAGHVEPIVVECSSAGTESRLLAKLQKSIPSLSTETNLVGTLTALRRYQGPTAGSKMLIVLDQFEQWLHSQRGSFNQDLVQALRQCDGQHLQCLLLVRDDFWLAVSRFLDELDVDLLEGQNTSFIDLFDQRHTRKVLAEFGRAYGCLPDDLTEMSSEQKSFLDRVVSELSQEEKVITVRLALFAEMVKGRPWTPATLKAVHGTEGVGVSFLDDTFTSAANPKHRQYRRPARSVLQALVPETGTGIKGSIRPVAELRKVSGLENRPRDFDELMRILDRETRLLTPTDPMGNTDDQSQTDATGEKYYQLTHDYLVPALRRWLTREQKKTRRGRAKLRLAERTKAWGVKREKRQLPAWWEALNILCLTRSKDWTEPQRTMMRKVGTRLALQFSMLVLLGVAMTWAGLHVRNQWIDSYAERLVSQLLTAKIDELPGIIDEIDNHRAWTDPKLRKHLGKPHDDSEQQLRVRFALLHADAPQLKSLERQLLSATPAEVSVLREELAHHALELPARLWKQLQTETERAHTLQAASTLAHCNPDRDQWTDVDDKVADALLSEDTVLSGEWTRLLQPVREKLIPSLSSAFRDNKRTETELNLAASVLAQYVEDPKTMVELLLDAEPFQFEVLYAKLERLLKTSGRPATQHIVASVLESDFSELESQHERDEQAKRQANAAILLLRWEIVEKVRRILKLRNDLRARSHFIDRAATLMGPRELLHLIQDEDEPPIRQALLLAATQSGADAFLETNSEWLLKMYETDSDPGVHSALEYLFRRYRQYDTIKRIDQKLTETGCVSREFYVNCEAHTMIKISGPVASRMKLRPGHNRGGDRLSEETIDYDFAIASKEVTRKQFARFLESFDPALQEAKLVDISPTDDCPVLGVNWFEAAAYCNWLSEQEGIPQEEWCYIFTREGARLGPDFSVLIQAFRGNHDKESTWLTEFWKTVNVRLAPNWIQKEGYRLPIASEWEVACGCGVETRFCFGSTEELLGKYAWYSGNSAVPDSSELEVERAHPVGTLLPNVFGLFDMHGNAWEWCQPSDWSAAEETEDGILVAHDARGVMRGASYASGTLRVTIGQYANDKHTNRDGKNGFRIARTHH